MGAKPAGSVFGEHSFYRETLGTRRWGRHVAKRSSDPRQAYPEVKLQRRDLVRVVGIVAHFATLGIGIRGKFVLLSQTGEMDTGDLGHVYSGSPRESQANFRDETVCGL